MARSVIFNGSSNAATVTLPNSSPFSAIGDFRLEAHIHDLGAATGTIFRNQHFAISYNTSTSVLSFFNLADITAATVNISGRTEFKLRCRRVASTGVLSIEVWDVDDTNRAVGQITSGTTGNLNWSIQTTYKFTIGATREIDNSTYSWMPLRMGWFRLRLSSGALDATPPAAGDATADGLSYEFEDNLNDSSVNAQHLTEIGTVSYATTPGSSGPPDPPVITLSASSGQITVSGSSAGATGYKVYRRTLKGSYNYSAPLADVSSLPYNDTTIANDRRYFYEVRAYNANGDSASSIEKVTSFHTSTTIDTENANTGTSSWVLSNPASAREIEGYASLTSVNKGSAIDFCISSSQTNYTIDIYRMGYYAGLGARQIGSQISKTNGTVQTMPTVTNDGAGGAASQATDMVECAWSVSHTYTVPSDATSGIYLAKLTQTTSGKQSYIIFCVRDDPRTAKLVYIQPVTTYQLYNNWGGKSGYGFNSVNTAGGNDALYGITFLHALPARKHSFNRPYAVSARSTRTNAIKGIGAGDFLTIQSSPELESLVNASGWELDTVMWLEQQGYDVKYVTNIDQHSSPSRWSGAKILLSVGHDEYWSLEMRNNTIAARDSGIHLSFLGANSAYWQIRFEADASAVANRRIIAWKEIVDPEPDNTLKTQLWRFDSNVPSRVGRPEEAFVGVMWRGYNANVALTAGTSSHWIYQGQGVTDGQTLGAGLVGYEYDDVFNEAGSSPAGLVTVFSFTFTGTEFHKGTVYETAAGVIVFATGTNQFSWGLFSNPLAVTDFRTNRTQTVVQELTKNVLDAQLTSATGVNPPAFFRGRNFPFFDDEEVNRFEFWPAITAAPTLSVAGVLAPSGTLARSVTRSLTASEVPDGAPLRLTTRSLNAIEVPASVILRQSQRSLAGLQAPSATMVRSLTKAVAGQATPVSTVSRAVQTSKLGALTPTSLLTALKLTLQSLTGLLTPSAVVRQVTSRSLSGQSGPSGVLGRVVSITKLGSVTPTGSLATLKAFLQSLLGSITPSSVLVRATSKRTSGQISPSSLLGKTVIVTRSGFLVPTGLLSTARAFLLQLAGSLLPVSVVAKLATRSLLSSQSPVGEIAKATAKSLTGSVALSATITTVRQVLLSIVASLTATGTVSQTLNLRLSGTTGPSGSVGKFLSRLLNAVLSLGGSLVNLPLNPQVKLDVATNDFVVTQLEINDATVNSLSIGDSTL